MTLLAETWPVSLPLPMAEYSGSPRNASVSAAAQEVVNARRSRFEKAYVELQVHWTFDLTQYATFRAFMQNDLGNGAAIFGIQLRYPQNSALTWWQVRFIGDVVPSYEEGHWFVDASFDLIRTYTP